MKLQRFRSSSADITDAHAPLALFPWPWPLTASSCHLSACFLWSLTAQSEQVPLLLILQLFLPIFLILGWISYPIPPEGEAQTSHSFLEPLSWSGRHLFCPPVSHSAPALQVSPTGLRTGRSSQQVCPDTLYSKAPLPPGLLATPYSCKFPVTILELLPSVPGFLLPSSFPASGFLFCIGR